MKNEAWASRFFFFSFFFPFLIVAVTMVPWALVDNQTRDNQRSTCKTGDLAPLGSFRLHSVSFCVSDTGSTRTPITQPHLCTHQQKIKSKHLTPSCMVEDESTMRSHPCHDDCTAATFLLSSWLFFFFSPVGEGGRGGAREGGRGGRGGRGGKRKGSAAGTKNKNCNLMALLGI